MTADTIDADSHAELTAKVIKCHEELQMYLTLLASENSILGSNNPLSKADRHIGGKEMLAMKYALASCDTNGDGKISEEEIERLKESSVDILSAHTEAQMNAGIVAALILSFMVPLSLEPIEASDDCVDFFSRDAVHYLKYLSIFFTLLANVSCIATIILAVRFGVYVNWIASALGRTLFVSTLDARLFPELQMLTLTTLQFAMIFRGALAGPLQGLAGIITYIMYNVFLHGAENSAGARAHNIQLKLVKDMFAEKPSSII
mgnify:FL=1|tara:strand:- start:267 stop:1049 length:783 start_codon:yes stop_codon:yes gene_type:complete